MNIKISGIGEYYPPYRLSNEELSNRFGIDGWLLSQIGVNNRLWATNPDTLQLEFTQVEMMKKATENMCHLFNINLNDIELIITVSTVADYTLPSMATLLQEALKIQKCNAIHIHCGCVGALQAIEIAYSMMQIGKAKNVLIATSNLMSTFWARDYKNNDMDNMDDQLNVAMFSDSASVICLSTSKEVSIEDVFSFSVGSEIPKGIYLEGGGAVYPVDSSVIELGKHKWKQKAKLIRKHGSMLSQKALERLLKSNSLSFTDIDHYIFPQANPSLLNEDMARLEGIGFPVDRIASMVSDNGNSATASLFHVLFKLFRQNKLIDGERVAIIGGEASKWLYGGVLFKWIK